MLGSAYLFSASAAEVYRVGVFRRRLGHSHEVGSSVGSCRRFRLGDGKLVSYEVQTPGKLGNWHLMRQRNGATSSHGSRLKTLTKAQEPPSTPAVLGTMLR